MGVVGDGQAGAGERHQQAGRQELPFLYVKCRLIFKINISDCHTLVVTAMTGLAAM